MFNKYCLFNPIIVLMALTIECSMFNKYCLFNRIEQRCFIEQSLRYCNSALLIYLI